MEACEDPRALAIWVWLSPLALLAWAAARVWASMTVGQPPARPWGRAAAKPAMVRSRIRSRSSSANTYRLITRIAAAPAGRQECVEGLPARTAIRKVLLSLHPKCPPREK